MRLLFSYSSLLQMVSHVLVVLGNGFAVGIGNYARGQLEVGFELFAHEFSMFVQLGFVFHRLRAARNNILICLCTIVGQCQEIDPQFFFAHFRRDARHKENQQQHEKAHP